MINVYFIVFTVLCHSHDSTKPAILAIFQDVKTGTSENDTGLDYTHNYIQKTLKHYSVARNMQ